MGQSVGKKRWANIMGDTIDKQVIRIQVGIAIAVLLSIIGAAFYLGQQVADLKGTINQMQVGDTHIIQNIKEDQARIAALEKQNKELEIELAQIKVKLAAIDLGIQEIKIDLREHTKWAQDHMD
jgi:septal ring factor EnvC (AmiA/AmiB activator)